MNAHHRQRRHLLSIFDRRGRAERAERLAAAEQAAEHAAEHEAAVRRILEGATRQLPVIDPAQPRRAPLLTPGQIHRNQAAER